ncbi:nucleotidyltransferase domain-containing protein [Candidatus Woesearchaeota archaeon]|nr:nucleotidyltransferase domain-containing protein [Candidatus Woesearchaeota archaeon]
MSSLTPKENEVLLTLFKDFSKNYNANSLSKQVDITPRGALKVLKNLHQRGLLVSQQFGKAVFYKVNLEDYYSFRTIETLLISEAREKASRWLSEFKELYKEVEIAIIFGSIIKEPRQANDIDILLVFAPSQMKAVKYFISEKNKILLKPIHPIMQSSTDIKKNLKKKDPVILNALRRGYVLHGYDKLIGVVKNVTSF